MKKKPDTHSPFAVLKEMKAKLEEEEQKAKAPPPAASSSAKRPLPQASTAKKRAPTPMLGSSDAADEALTFHRMMSGVQPLDRKTGRISLSQSSLEPSPGAELAARRHADARSAQELEAEEVHAHLRQLVEGKVRFEVEDDGRYVEGRRVDLPAESLRKLRRGIIPIDGRLDLHGRHAGDARDAVESFLREKRARGERCVLLVHGKGEHSPRGQGVLRGEIAAWLSQGTASEHVAAFATATPEDGGEGALYVLLRR